MLRAAPIAAVWILALAACLDEPGGSPDAAVATAPAALVTDDVVCPQVGASPELIAACERRRAELGAACNQAQTAGERLWCLARYLESSGGPHLRQPRETITVGRYDGSAPSFTYLDSFAGLRYAPMPYGPWGTQPASTTCAWTAADCPSGTTPASADDPAWLPLPPLGGSPRANVNAIGVSVRFEYRGCAHPARLRVTAYTVKGEPPTEGTVTAHGTGFLQVVDRTAPPGDGELTVDVAHAAALGWAMWCDGADHGASNQGTAHVEHRLVGDPLKIDRAAQIGAFTVPVLPISIAYAPVQDMGAHNVAHTTLSSAHALELSTSVSSETSQGVPVEPGLWQGAGTMKEVFDVGAKVFGASSTTEVKAIGYVFEAASKLVGTASATSTDGSATTADGKVTLTYAHARVIDSASDAHDPSRRLGPGPGDQILYVPDFRGIWAVTDDRVWLSPIEPPGFAHVPVADLLLDWRDLAEPDCRGERTGLAAADIRSLLMLDPNVAAPVHLPCGLAGWTAPRFDSDRFEVVSPNEVIRRDRGVATFTRSASTCEAASQRSWTARVEIYSPGILQSALGTQAGTLSTRVEHMRRAETCVTEDRRVAVDFFAAAFETYAARILYDRDLGSFPITPVATIGQPLSTGGDGDGDGVPDDREQAQGTDPGDRDSDGDGVDDGTEIMLGTSPALADTDGDGIDDHDDDRPWCVGCTWLHGALSVEPGTIPAAWTGELIVAPGPTTMVVAGPASVE